jgi:hypothetical protein
LLRLSSSSMRDEAPITDMWMNENTAATLLWIWSTSQTQQAEERERGRQMCVPHSHTSNK